MISFALHNVSEIQSYFKKNLSYIKISVANGIGVELWGRPDKQYKDFK